MVYPQISTDSRTVPVLIFLCEYVCVCVQGAVDAAAALWLGFTCSKDGTERLWEFTAVTETKQQPL